MKNMGEGKMPNKQDPVTLWSNSHRGRELLSKHGLDDDGIWRAYGEDPNCDLGGYHGEPLLGTFSGRLRDVVAYVSTLSGWYQWGSGGRIEAYLPPRIKRIEPGWEQKHDELKKQERKLAQELKRVRNQLGIDDDD